MCEHDKRWENITAYLCIQWYEPLIFNEYVQSDHILLSWLDQLSCVKKLLDNGADPLIKDNNNQTALFYAEINGDL